MVLDLVHAEDFSLFDGSGFGKNVIIDNKKNYILTFDKGQTDGLDDTTLTVEKEY